MRRVSRRSLRHRLRRRGATPSPSAAVPKVHFASIRTCWNRRPS